GYPIRLPLPRPILLRNAYIREYASGPALHSAATAGFVAAVARNRIRRAKVARVDALRLRIARRQTFEVGRGEIIEQQRVVEVKQGPFALGQRRFELFAVGMKFVQIAVKRLVTELAEVAV